MTAKSAADEKPPLHIVSLKSENVKRLRAVTITPDGNLVVIGGRNRQGKTSVLDSIALAIGGTKGMPAKPIREGATSASIILDLGEIIVERKITAGGPTLIVRSADGTRLMSPQAILDGLTSRVSFDPLKFMTMDAVSQADTIRRLAGLDFTAQDAERAKVYAERTGVNRDVTTQQMRVQQMPHHEDAPKERVDTAALLQRLEKAVQENNSNAAKREVAETRRKNVKTASEAIADLERKLAEARKNLVAAQEAATKAEEEAAAAVDVDLGPLKNEIATADTANARYDANTNRAKEVKRLEELAAVARELTARIETIDSDKTAAISKAKYPVEGLTFDQAGVMFNGIPLAQASNAEQLRVSVAVGIAMNPRLKVLLVRDGSLLDEENLALLAKLAEESNAQVWVERVGKGDECSVIIEDGQVEEVRK